MKTLVEEYCQECEQKEYEISGEVLEKVLKRLANDKPGRDLVAGLWLKKLRSVKVHYKQQLKQLLRNESEPPNWLLTSKTLLLPRNEMTSQAQNYRPIALQNTMYKVYLTDIPRQREEYEVIYGMRRNAECHITSILRAGVEYLFYFMTNSRYIFVTK